MLDSLNKIELAAEICLKFFLMFSEQDIDRN